MNKAFAKKMMICMVFLLLFVSSAYSATITVTNNNDSGAGSLRQAISDAIAGDTILFDISFPATITLSSTLTLNKNLTISGPGYTNLALSGNNAVRVFDVTSGTIVLSKMTISNGRVTSAGSDGAGLRVYNGVNLTIDRCVINNHQLSGGNNTGGAVWMEPNATITIHRSRLDGNTVPLTSGCYGGAIYATGDVTFISCTLSGNRAYLGGAIANYGASGKTFSMTNCTVSGNESDVDGVIVNQLSGSMSLTNCTVTNNVSGQYEAGLFADAGTVTLRNTIIAGNLPSVGLGDTDIFFDTAGLFNGNTAILVSGGYNLIGSTGTQTYTWTTGDVVGTEASKQLANLGSLADNGGYVQTHDPNPGSQVINPASSNSAPFVDGRGYLRSSTAEKGACEDGGSLPAATSATGVGDTSFTANWNSVSSASGYLLDVAEDSDFTTMVSGYHDLDVSNVVTYPVAGLAGSTPYYYRVRAYNSVHQSYYSNTISLATLAAATATFTPTITPTVTTTDTPTATMTVTHSPTQTPSNTPSMTVTVSATTTPTAPPSATFTSTPSVTLTSTVTMTATPSATVTQTSTQTPFVTATPTATVTLTTTVSSTSTITASETVVVPVVDVTLSAYPNPARDQMAFTVDLENAGNVKIMIFNLLGEQIAVLKESLPAGPSTMLWQCGTVSPGIYLVRINTGTLKKTFKVAVVK